MTDTPQLLLAHHLKALRLPTFLREYDKVVKQCANEGVDHSRYLLRLAELELTDRERHMVERRIHCLAGDVYITEKGGCKVPRHQKSPLSWFAVQTTAGQRTASTSRPFPR